MHYLTNYKRDLIMKKLYKLILTVCLLIFINNNLFAQQSKDKPIKEKEKTEKQIKKDKKHLKDQNKPKKSERLQR